VHIRAHVDTWRASFRELVFDKRTQEVKLNSTKARQEIANTLQNSTFVRKQVDANRRAGSQVKCTAIDSINREKIQHVVCSSERAGVNRVMALLRCSDTNVPPNLSAVTQEVINHSNSNEDVAEDLAI